MKSFILILYVLWPGQAKPEATAGEVPSLEQCISAAKVWLEQDADDLGAVALGAQCVVGPARGVSG